MFPELRDSSVVRSGNRSSEDLNEQCGDVTGQVACSSWVLETRRRNDSFLAADVGRGNKQASLATRPWLAGTATATSNTCCAELRGIAASKQHFHVKTNVSSLLGHGLCHGSP